MADTGGEDLPTGMVHGEMQLESAWAWLHALFFMVRWCEAVGASAVRGLTGATGGAAKHLHTSFFCGALRSGWVPRACVARAVGGFTLLGFVPFMTLRLPFLLPARRAAQWALRVAVVSAVLSVGGWRAPDVQALEFQVQQMRQTMQARFGEGGVQRLQAWLDFLEKQGARSQQQQLVAVNDFWNQNVVGSEDSVIWGETEYWATPIETLGKRAADCEDFVIGKYFSLLRLGVPVDKLRFIYVRARVGGLGSTQSIAHMVLGYYETPQSEPLVLDNLMGSLVPASQRKDLTPVFSFNAQGIYVAGAQPASVERISRWKGLMARMQQEGIVP